MSEKTPRGIPMMLVGIAIGVGYYLYLLHEMSGKPQEIRVSLMLPFLSLLLVAIGTMQLTLGDAKTTQLMAFNASNLSKRDLMVAAVIVAGMLGVMVGLALFLDAHGYR